MSGTGSPDTIQDPIITSPNTKKLDITAILHSPEFKKIQGNVQAGVFRIPNGWGEIIRSCSIAQHERIDDAMKQLEFLPEDQRLPYIKRNPKLAILLGMEEIVSNLEKGVK